MALLRSSRRLSLKTILRDAVVMLAGTVLGILLSHMFFADKSTSERGMDLETLCADSSNAPLPHLAKRSDDKLRHLRSRLALNQPAPPRPLPAVWGTVMSKNEVATRGERETLADEGDDGGLDSELVSGSGADGGSGHPQVATKHLEETTPQTTDSLVPLHASSNDFVASTDNERTNSNSLSTLKDSETEDDKSTRHNSLIIGVRASSLDRYTAVRKTWGLNAQKLVYFSSMKESGFMEGDAPVVNLSEGVRDHAHKLHPNTYQLLKYMHDNFFNDFGWFIGTNDNVYVRVDQLTNYLAKLDPNGEQCFGPPDSGGQKINPEMEGYGVEGPVTIFSRGLLKKLSPHLERCLMNSSTSNDTDVERCLRENVAFQCERNSEISQLFMTDNSNGKIFLHPDTQTIHQLLEALAVYPIPSPGLMLRVHQFYLELAINKLKSRTNQLVSELERLTSLISS